MTTIMYDFLPMLIFRFFFVFLMIKIIKFHLKNSDS